MSVDLPAYVMEHVFVKVVATCPTCRRRLERDYEVSTACIDAERAPGAQLTLARQHAKDDIAHACGLCREKREDDKERARQ